MRRPAVVVIALGSNVGDRMRHLRAAVHAMPDVVRVARISHVWESDPIDCPDGSGAFLNMALSGTTRLPPRELLEALHAIERRAGRRRRRTNESRPLDLDLIFYGALLSATDPALPHPRYAQRAFVLEPLRELDLDWTVAGRRVRRLEGNGVVRHAGMLF